MSSRGEVRHSFSFDADNSEVLGLSRKKWRGPLCLEIWKSSIPFGEEITGSYHLLSLSDCFLSPFPWLLLPQNCPLILQNGRLCPLLWDVKMPGAHWHWRQRRVLWESSAHLCVEMIHSNWSGGWAWHRPELCEAFGFTYLGLIITSAAQGRGTKYTQLIWSGI